MIRFENESGSALFWRFLTVGRRASRFKRQGEQDKPPIFREAGYKPSLWFSKRTCCNRELAGYRIQILSAWLSGGIVDDTGTH